MKETEYMKKVAVIFCAVFLAMYIPTQPKSKLLKRCLCVLLIANLYNFAYTVYKNMQYLIEYISLYKDGTTFFDNIFVK